MQQIFAQSVLLSVQVHMAGDVRPIGPRTVPISSRHALEHGSTAQWGVAPGGGGGL